MTGDFLKRVGSRRFALKEQYIPEVEKHAHDVFKRVVKTARRYAVTSEPAEILVECAKNKHGNSFAGLMGSMHGGLVGRSLYRSEEEDEEGFERGLAAYQAFESEFTSFLVSELEFDPLPKVDGTAVLVTAGSDLGSKIRAKKADLREKTTPATQAIANNTFQSVCRSATAFEKQGLPAADVVDFAIAAHEEGFSSLSSTLEAELISGACDDGRGWGADRAHLRSKEVIGFFKRDLRRFIMQQIVELRTERIENA